eukprot:scaffold5517_cov135-Cylindrotheca_fusiformis.AAC.48
MVRGSYSPRATIARGQSYNRDLKANIWLTLRSFSWQGHGTDLLSDSLSHNGYGIPKVVLHGHSQTGFDCNKILKKIDMNDKSLDKSMGIVHLNGSILCFPNACYMWNVPNVGDLTIESLSPVTLCRPKLEYLFLGSNETIHPNIVKKIRDAMTAECLKGSRPAHIWFIGPNSVSPQSTTTGEDRMVCAALILNGEKNSGNDS